MVHSFTDFLGGDKGRDFSADNGKNRRVHDDTRRFVGGKVFREPVRLAFAVGEAAFFEHPLHGVAGEFGGVGEVELGFDVLAVGFHGFAAEFQAGRDFAGGQRFADQPEHFQFAVGQAV